MVDAIAEDILSFLLTRGGLAERQDMPHRNKPEFNEAVKYLARNGMITVRVSDFDGLTTYRIKDN